MLETRRNKRHIASGKTRKNKCDGIFMQNISNYSDYFIQADRTSNYISLKQLSNKSQLLDLWIPIQIHIVEGLRILHINQKHYGLINSESVFIDISGNAKLVEPVISDYDFIYNDALAPEYHILAGLKHGFSGDQLLDDIFSKNLFLQKVDNLFYSWPIETFIKSLDTSDLQKYEKMYLPNADIWSLGHLLFTIYMNFIADSHVLTSKFYKNNHRVQMKIFEGMLNPDPRKRFTVDNILNELYTLRMDCVLPDTV